MSTDQDDSRAAESRQETEGQPTGGRDADKAANALDVAIDILEDVQKVISGGRPRMLRVRLGDRIVAEMPVTLTAVAAFAAGVAAVLLTKLVIEIDRED